MMEPTPNPSPRLQIFARKDRDQQEFEELVDGVTGFLQRRRVGTGVQGRIKEWLNFRREADREAAQLQVLSQCIAL